MFSGALFINESIEINLYVAVVVLLIISAAFTIGGGLTAVIWTVGYLIKNLTLFNNYFLKDFIQTIIMLLGAFYLMIVGTN